MIPESVKSITPTDPGSELDSVEFDETVFTSGLISTGIVQNDKVRYASNADEKPFGQTQAQDEVKAPPDTVHDEDMFAEGEDVDSKFMPFQAG